MFANFNNFLNIYVYLPEIFFGFFVLLLLLFLVYDSIFLDISLADSTFVKKKKLIINSSVIFLILLFILVLFALYMNSYTGVIQGDSFIVSPFIIFSKRIFLLIAFLVMLIFFNYSRYMKAQSFEFYFSFLLVMFSSILLMQANNLVSFYILIELQSIVLYFLLAFDRSSSISVESGLKYFLVSIFMSIIFLLGVAFIYISYGSTNFTILSLLMYRLEDLGISIYGFALFFIFIFFKLAVVPFHFWALDVYVGASWPVLSVLSVLSKLPLIVFLTRVFLLMGFDVNFNFGLNFVLVLFDVTGFLSVLFGTIGAVYYMNFRKILVYSGIANIGYILLSIGSSNFLAIFFAYIYFMFYSFVTVLLLYLFSLIFRTKFAEYTFQFRGLASRYFYMGFLFLFIFFIFIGLPPLAGFWTKFLLLYSMVTTGAVLKALFIFVFNILSAVYYIRIIREMYFGKSLEELDKIKVFATDFDFIITFLVVFLLFTLVLLFVNFDMVIWIILSIFA